MSRSPRFAGDGVIVVSVKFAVVNFPKVPPLGVLGADTVDEVAGLALLVELVTEVDVDVDTAVELALLDEPRLVVAADEVLKAVIVSNDTVGFFSLLSLTCNKKKLETSTCPVSYKCLPPNISIPPYLTNITK